jgi:hypothetical protein
MEQRRRVLFTAPTALDFRYAPGPELPLLPLPSRVWPSGWPGICHRRRHARHDLSHHPLTRRRLPP